MDHKRDDLKLIRVTTMCSSWRLLGFSLCVAVARLSVLVSPAIADDDLDVPAAQVEFFEKEVRPLLVERCHACHGSDKQKGSLRLDSRVAVLQGGDTGPAIVPKHPDESELVKAIRYGDDGYQMPPDGKLPQEEIDRLSKWVEMGAPWPSEQSVSSSAGVVPQMLDFDERTKHWSFQPLQRPKIPTVENVDWCRSPIDRFLLTELEEAGITPVAETDRSTWLRRVSFDVIGLPPTPEELETFLNDNSPDAYETVINRLLSSPHFGERWGRHWLDLVRYAESRGHEFDFDVANPWHYRDYVIRALNDDVPFDQFVVEHVAGDLLKASGGRQSPDEIDVKSPTDGGLTSPARHSLRLHPQTGANESILATGFWYLGEWVHSPVDIRQDEADRFENMIDVYSKTFLGLTVACARCHDHKFDPITQKDFYALQGYLQSSCYRQARFETMENYRLVVESPNPSQIETDSQDDGLVCESDGHLLETDWRPHELMPDPAPLWQLQHLFVSMDASTDKSSQSGDAPSPTEWWSLRVDSPELQSPHGDAEPGSTSPFLPGVRLRTPTFEIQSGKLHCLVRGDIDVYVAIDSHILIKGPLHGTLVKRFDQMDHTAWRWATLDVSRYSGHRAHLEFSPLVGKGSGIARVVQSTDPPTAADDPATATAPSSMGSSAETGQLILASALAPAMVDGSGEDEYVFIRGNWKKRGDVVPRRFLEVFGGGETPRPEYGSGRLELASWMVHPQKTPILPRVIVNRIWQHYFGVGLVSTPDDFGHMGRPPSHPELLDWLACELVRSGWSLKHIHQLILNSTAYRMSSESTSDGDTQPSTLNPQLYARMPIKRLEGEIIRDAMLLLSGRLDDRMEGRSVPVHLTSFMEGRGRPSESGPVDGAGRRSLYIAVRRNFPDPFFQAFDMPNPHTTTGRRTVSNVPAQALALMNNPMVIELSRQWAERLLTELPDATTETRVRQAYLACVSREPTETEVENAVEFLQQQAEDLGTPSNDSRVWADLCQVLLNTKEFLFVQ